MALFVNKTEKPVRIVIGTGSQSDLRETIVEPGEVFEGPGVYTAHFKRLGLAEFVNLPQDTKETPKEEKPNLSEIVEDVTASEKPFIQEQIDIETKPLRPVAGKKPGKGK